MLSEGQEPSTQGQVACDMYRSRTDAKPSSVPLSVCGLPFCPLVQLIEFSKLIPIDRHSELWTLVLMARHISVLKTVHCLDGLGQGTDTHLGSRIIFKR